MNLNIVFIGKIIELITFFKTGNSAENDLVPGYVYRVRQLFEELIGKTKETGWISTAHRKSWTHRKEQENDGREFHLERGDPNYAPEDYWVYLILAAYVARLISYGFDKAEERHLMKGYVDELVRCAIPKEYLPGRHNFYAVEIIAWGLNGHELDYDSDLNRNMIKRVGYRMGGLYKKALRRF